MENQHAKWFSQILLDKSNNQIVFRANLFDDF